MIFPERLRLGLNKRRSLPVVNSVLRGKAKPYRTAKRQSRIVALSVCTFLCGGCGEGARRTGIPAGAQSVLETAIEDIDAGRYEKLYEEAADEWRRDATLDQSKATFRTLHDRLGNVRTRSFETAREEQTGTAPIPGHSLVVLYQTSFERGDGIETFTLIERGGRWYLAKYYVTSTALK